MVPAQVRSCKCVLLLLTRNVLNELHTLVALWFAITAKVPVLTVFLDGGGYDYVDG